MEKEFPMKMNKLAKWFNAVAEAYNRGEAYWAYPDGISLSVKVWNERGDEGFVAWAQEMGIALKSKQDNYDCPVCKLYR